VSAWAGWVDAALRRGLFALAPEASHHAALDGLAAALRAPGGYAALRGLYGGVAGAPVDVAGLRFPNAVGLAAGYDKDATAWRAFPALGFGHVEIGTVTPKPQPGNPKPRVFRLEPDRAVINRMGFPSAGAAAVRARLTTERPEGMILGVNLGKNKDTPNEDAADDYVAGVHAFADVADYLVVNVSSPNTPGLRALQTGEALRRLLRTVVDARDAAAPGRTLPVFVKLAPDLEPADLTDAVVALQDAGVEGVVATNTTLSRHGASGPAAAEVGGLSGAPLTARALRTLEAIRALVPAGFPVIGVGGLMTPDDVRRRRDAGADLVQIYTGLIYGGPSVVGPMAKA
jgi:dihydroorotate dehydrogenase